MQNSILMVALGIALALIVGVLFSIICTKNKHFETIILSLANIVQVVPSLAMLAILMIVFGAGFNTVVIGLFLYSLLPIIRNTFVGLNEVNKSSVEAGEGMGMTKLQLLIRVKIPLALPFILAGSELRWSLQSVSQHLYHILVVKASAEKLLQALLVEISRRYMSARLLLQY